MTAMLLLGVAGIVTAYAQKTAAAVSVPFVGCESSGQIATLEAPKGASKRVPIRSKDAQALAWYESADRIGVLAPRGWNCLGVSGSGGYALYISPQAIRHDVSGWTGLEGPAIEVNHITGENSGEYEIAEVVARVLPTLRASAAALLQTMDLPLPAGPFPKDTLSHRGKAIVEYNTPAQVEGLGNFDSWLGKSDLPIRGAAILISAPSDVWSRTDMVLLSVRLPPSLTSLTTVIVRQLERDTITSGSK